MQPQIKHALGNPSLWINVGCLLSALVVTAMNDEWVKHYPLVVMALGTLNFATTSFLQYMRDLKKHPGSSDSLSNDVKDLNTVNKENK